jgi:hypothetical protein
VQIERGLGFEPTDRQFEKLEHSPLKMKHILHERGSLRIR